jgi:hypothetical protein
MIATQSSALAAQIDVRPASCLPVLRASCAPPLPSSAPLRLCVKNSAFKIKTPSQYARKIVTVSQGARPPPPWVPVLSGGFIILFGKSGKNWPKNYADFDVFSSASNNKQLSKILPPRCRVESRPAPRACFSTLHPSHFEFKIEHWSLDATIRRSFRKSAIKFTIYG